MRKASTPSYSQHCSCWCQEAGMFFSEEEINNLDGYITSLEEENEYLSEENEEMREELEKVGKFLASIAVSMKDVLDL